MKLFFTLAWVFISTGLGLGQVPQELREAKKALDVAFVIDCSVSMTYALDDAKKKIVEIVNKLDAENRGVYMRVGFIRYGSGTTKWQKSDLSNNVMLASAYLHSLKADIGTREFPGYFIQTAMEKLDWGKDTRKLVYIVGNENPHQGPEGFDYTVTVPFLTANGFTVNSIFAGYGGKAKNASIESRVQGEIKDWAEIAALGKGEFINLYRAGK